MGTWSDFLRVANYAQFALLQPKAINIEMDQPEGADIFFHDFIQEELEEAGLGQVSLIQNFFAGATVFLTGGTGFLGQTLVEKLLRVTSVRKIYMLIRPQGEMSPQARLRAMLDGVLFSAVSNQRADIHAAVEAVPGDCSLPDLGLSPAARGALTRETDVVIHAAASGHANTHFRTAITVNVRSTKLLLHLAKQMRRVKSFVLVSSSYSNFNQSQVLEKVYPAVFNHDKLLTLADILDDQNLDLLKPNLLRGWADTHTFTKHIAESLVQDLQGGLPVGIIRPAIVVSTAFEPLVGWVKACQGPQAAVLTALSGLTHVLHAKRLYRADLVPVDLVASALLAFAWHIGKGRVDGPNMEDLSQIESCPRADDSASVPVLNYGSALRNSITWAHFTHLCFLYGTVLPKLTDYVPHLTIQSNEKVVMLLQFVFHFVPAAFYDLLLYVTGSTPKWVSMYRSLHVSSRSLAALTCKQSRLYDHNTWALWDKLGPKDRALFNLDVASVDWNEFIKLYVRGIRTYLGQEHMSTLPAATKRMAKLVIVHNAGKALVVASVLYLVGRLYIHLLFHS